MKPIKQYVLLVDNRRHTIATPDGKLKDLYRRSVAGRYRVAAKTEKEAIQLLREKIGFGSIQIYYEDKNPRPEHILPYKSVKKEIYKEGLKEPTHATDKQSVKRANAVGKSAKDLKIKLSIEKGDEYER